MQKLEMIFPFDENEYTNEGIHIESDQFILDQQEVWEAEFYSKSSNQAKKKINFVEYKNQAATENHSTLKTHIS